MIVWSSLRCCIFHSLFRGWPSQLLCFEETDDAAFATVYFEAGHLSCCVSRKRFTTMLHLPQFISRLAISAVGVSDLTKLNVSVLLLLLFLVRGTGMHVFFFDSCFFVYVARVPSVY